MTQNLGTTFPEPDDLLSLEPEELAGVILGIANQSDGFFSVISMMAPLYSFPVPPYPQSKKRAVTIAIAESFAWLTSRGLIISDPDQHPTTFIVTRRGNEIRTGADLKRFRTGRILPVDLLQQYLVNKIYQMFLRSDHDVAVFQAFKEVEVFVRNAANARGASYADDLVGVALMRKAFHPETGPLTDKSRVPGEREAEMHLFAGAMGHAKNPASHRETGVGPLEAARLIVLASHLLSLLEQRLL